MTTTTTMTMTKTTPSSTITKIPDRFFLRCTRATEDSLAIRFARCTLHRNCCESTEEGKCYCESEIDIKIYRKWEWKKNRAAARKWEKFHGNDGTKMWNLVSCILYKCGFSSAHFSYTLFETFISRRAITSFMAYSGRKTKFRIVCFFFASCLSNAVIPRCSLGHRRRHHQHIHYRRRHRYSANDTWIFNNSKLFECEWASIRLFVAFAKIDEIINARKSA